MNSGSSGSYDKPRNQELDNRLNFEIVDYLYISINGFDFYSSSHVPHVTDFNSQPSTTFKTENVWLNAVSDIIKQDSFADGESMTGIHLYSENNTTADPTSQIVPVQNQNAQFLRSGAGVGIGSSIKAYSHTSPFESSELGKKRTRRNLVTEENSLDDILSQSNICPTSFYRIENLHIIDIKYYSNIQVDQPLFCDIGRTGQRDECQLQSGRKHQSLHRCLKMSPHGG